MKKITFLRFGTVLTLLASITPVSAQTMFADTATAIYEYQNGVKTTFASGLSGLAFMNFDPTGDLFAISGSSILEFANTGGVLSSTPTTVVTGLQYYNTGNQYTSYPDSMAFDSAGNMYVNDSGSTANPLPPGGSARNSAKTYRFTYNSGTGTFNQSTISLANVYQGTEIAPLGQITYNNGRLYSPQNYGGGVQIFSTGSVTNNMIVAANGANANKTAGGEGSAVDSLGNIYVSIYAANNMGGAIMEIPAGADQNTVPTTFATGLSYVRALAFDTNGDLVATGLNSIIVYTNFNGTLSSTPTVTTLSGVEALAFQPVLTPVPEPVTWALVSAGGLALLAGRRPKKA